MLRSDLDAALQVAQQGMLSLQKLQEQTAQLHRQFLEGQDAVRRTLEALLDQRSALVNPAPGSALTFLSSADLPAGVPSQNGNGAEQTEHPPASPEL